MNLSVQTGIRSQVAGVGGTPISAADYPADYNLQQGSRMKDLSATSILAAICVVIVVTIGGIVLSPTNTVMIAGFGTMVATNLLLVLRNERTATKVDEVAADVREVHLATNSMKDQLVAKTEQEALARGGKEERERAAGATGPTVVASPGEVVHVAIDSLPKPEIKPEEQIVPTPPRPPMGGR